MPRVFISYRRDDSAFVAATIHRTLSATFGDGNVFIDVDDLPPGRDFRKEIAGAIERCDVVLVIMQDAWLTITNEAGTRRLDVPNDYVRLEIEAALQRGIPVIPVLVGGARMPTPTELPEPIADFAFRQSLHFRPGRDFARDLELMESSIRRAVEGDQPMRAAGPRPTPGTPPPAMRRLRVQLGLIGVAGSAVGLLALATYPLITRVFDTPESPPPTPPPTLAKRTTMSTLPRSTADVGKVYEIPIADSPVRGPRSARVTITEFGDYQCPFCAQSNSLVKQVLAAYPRDVKFVFKQFPLQAIHPNAQPAAKAALAAGRQGKYWEMHDQLYTHSRELGAADLERYAAAVNLDVSRWKKDIGDPALKAQIDRDVALASATDVRGTPTFFVNGERLMKRTFEGFSDMIEEALKGR